MDGLVDVFLVWLRSIAARFGFSVSSLASAVWPSSAHVIACSKNKSSSFLVRALAFLAATLRKALARKLLVWVMVIAGWDSGCGGVEVVSGGSAAKAGKVA